MSINYIASAGTGKTYSLVSEVLDKIKTKNVSIKNMLILTFTDKAASELKEKIASRIKEEISRNSPLTKQEKEKLHREILHLDNAYIGTFHSIFFKLLKRYPLESKIDSSYEIIANEIDEYLNLWFESWIEKDFNNDKNIWQEILKNISVNYNNIKNTFITLYKNRSKLKEKKMDLETQKNKIDNLFSELENLINKIKQDSEIYNAIKEAEIQGYRIFKITPESLERFLKYKDLSILDIDNKGNTIFKKSTNGLSEQEKAFFEKVIEPLREKKNLKDIEEALNELLLNLKKEIRDYNANLLLTKFFNFLEFVEKQKQENKLLDFDDIIKRFLNLLYNHEKVREDIKNQFKYIFVDEFQDTDSNQTKILNKISNNNVYVFGDPKQCIYTWREADLKVYFDFIKNLESKTLENNYRSCPELIKFFNTLFSQGDILDHIDSEYKKEVKVGKPEEWENKNCYVKFITLKQKGKNIEKKEEEARYTVKLIKELVEKENYKFKDIMILFRKNEDLLTFYKILSSCNIPVISYSAQNLFKSPEVVSLLNILKYIENPNSKIAKLKVLKSPLFYRKDQELINNFNLDGKNAKILQDLIQNKHSLTVEQIIEKILNETDFMESLALEENGKQKIENIRKINLLSKQKTIEGLSLRDFLHFTETYQEDIPVVEDEDAVILMTMHKSKGLESKVVIIPLISLEPKKIELNNIHVVDEEPLINMPSSKAVSKGIKDKEIILKKSITDENKRLFYVATTRAKEKLIFIQWEGKSGKNSFRTYLNSLKDKIKEFIEEGDLLEEITPYQTSEETNNIKNLLEEIKEKEKQREDLFNKAISESRFTSVSQIMKEEHKEEEIKKDFSKTKEENLGIYIGVLVHGVLEKVDIQNYSFEQAKMTLNSLESTIPDIYREAVIKKAQDILQKFENSAIHNELKDSQILYKELPFTLYENGKFIEGRIDLIYKKNDKIVVMDYKTNKYQTEEEKQKIIQAYEKQKEYYLKAVRKIFPEEKIDFKLGLLWKGEIV